MGVTVFSKSLSSNGGTTVSYTQFSWQSRIALQSHLFVEHVSFFFTFVEEPVLIIIIIIIQVMSAQQLPDLHHSWGLFHLLPLVHKLHQICPIHLFLQPHLETKGSDNMNCDAWHCQSAFFFSFKSFSAPHVVANLIVSLSSVQTGLTTGLNLVISLKCEMHLVLYFELKQLLILHLLHVSWISWLALVIEYKLPLRNGLLVIKKGKILLFFH